MSNRYQVFDGSITCHCCFEYTVVDTSKPTYIGEQHYVDHKGRKHYDAVCECFDLEDARKVCAALNAVQVNDASLKLVDGNVETVGQLVKVLMQFDPDTPVRRQP